MKRKKAKHMTDIFKLYESLVKGGVPHWDAVWTVLSRKETAIGRNAGLVVYELTAKYTVV